MQHAMASPGTHVRPVPRRSDPARLHPYRRRRHGALPARSPMAWPLIDQMNPAADTLALSSIEFDLSKVEPSASRSP